MPFVTLVHLFILTFCHVGTFIYFNYKNVRIYGSPLIAGIYTVHSNDLLLSNDIHSVIIELERLLSYERTKYRMCCMSCDRKYMFTGSLQSTDTQDDSNM